MGVWSLTSVSCAAGEEIFREGERQGSFVNDPHFIPTLSTPTPHCKLCIMYSAGVCMAHRSCDLPSVSEMMSPEIGL